MGAGEFGAGVGLTLHMLLARRGALKLRGS